MFYSSLRLEKIMSQFFNDHEIQNRGTRMGRGGGGGWNPSPEFSMCCSILKRFYLWWKAFDLLNKLGYIL